jgi:tetratricopeptide (TPR) repeat protein
VSLALAYRGLERFEAARQAAQRAIDLNPRLAEAYEVLATCYYSAPTYGCARPRDPDMAERLFRKALELDPQLGTAHGSLSAHIGWMGRDQDALDYSDAILARRPRDVGIMRGRSAQLLYLKRPDESEQQLREVASLAPTSIQDEWVAAGIELMRGNPDAESRLAAAVARGPVTLREIDTARLYGVVGNPRMSAIHLDRAFRADATCAAYVQQSPVFATLRSHVPIQDVIGKYRAP